MSGLEAFGYTPKEVIPVPGFRPSVADAIDPDTLETYVALRIRIGNHDPDSPYWQYRMTADAAEWLAGQLTETAAKVRRKAPPWPTATD
ncbi:MAG TPA: hypothetical protein VG435_13365 [Acidimicrobiales bacterium]|jgi:hypothetical protein|nr:hypothetical protein [Acidimicrobiales bacterium]